MLFCSTLSIVTAGALSPIEAIASLANSMAAPTQGKALQVFWEAEPQGQACTGPKDFCRLVPEVDMFYYFYVGQAGVGVDPCNSDPINTKGYRAPEQSTAPAIQGEWDVEVPGLGKCRFQGLGRAGEKGDNGWLHCPNRPAIMCLPDRRLEDKCLHDNTVTAKALSFCNY